MSNIAATQFEVTVVYNGVSKSIEVNPNQSVQAVLQHALNEFGIRQNRENFGLFAQTGQELDTAISAEAAGITPESQLLLRPRRVAGG